MDEQQIQRQADDFLNCATRENFYTLPYNNDAYSLAAHSREGRTVHVLTGECLIKQNIKCEADRLGMSLHRLVIDKLTDKLWSSLQQKEKFETLANNANEINETNLPIDNDTCKRALMMNKQETHCQFTNDIYNGGKFCNNDGM
jgi:hypothetical protein